MSGVKVKICGLRHREDIEYVNQYKPDFVGFVFYEKSKRAVSAAQAQELRMQPIAEACASSSACR